jgi:16S rRNA (uracil1498-N3)-methyltransferase
VTRSDSDEIALSSDKAHHVRTVLRMRKGDGLMLHDGAGNAALAKIVMIEKSRVGAKLVAPWTPVLTEPARKLTVFQALPKIGEKAEQILQHGVELGVHSVVFFASEKSTALDSGDRAARKVARWEDIARNAAEQSGRGIVPSVFWAGSLTEALERSGSARLVFQPGSVKTLADAPDGPLDLFFGPEHGFASAEIAQIGGEALTLGPRILRTETAALAALARLLL